MKKTGGTIIHRELGAQFTPDWLDEEDEPYESLLDPDDPDMPPDFPLLPELPVFPL